MVNLFLLLVLALATTTPTADATRTVSVQAVFGLNVNCKTLARRVTGGRVAFLANVRSAALADARSAAGRNSSSLNNIRVNVSPCQDVMVRARMLLLLMFCYLCLPFRCCCVLF